MDKRIGQSDPLSKSFRELAYDARADLGQAAFGLDERGEDPSDQPARLVDQLTWLRNAARPRRRRRLNALQPSSSSAGGFGPRGPFQVPNPPISPWIHGDRAIQAPMRIIEICRDLAALLARVRVSRNRGRFGSKFSRHIRLGTEAQPPDVPVITPSL